MSQLQTTIEVTRARTRSDDHRHLLAIVAAVAATGLLILAMALTVGRGIPFSGGSGGGVTDGWMHGTSALAVRVAAAPEITDGWAARYLPSAQASRVTDGWAARYLPSAQGR